MRGIEVVAPYSPTDRGTGSGFARCSNSLSTSKERQTATRAPLGQTLGVSFLPILAVPTACRSWASVESTVMGFAAPGRAGDWEFDDELKTKLTQGSLPSLDGQHHMAALDVYDLRWILVSIAVK